MIESIAAFGMICIATSAVYLLKHRETKSESNEYIWVGPGKSPFRK